MERAFLREIVADVLEVEPEDLDSDTDLTTMEAFDSVSVLTLMIELDDQCGIRLSPADTRELKRFGDIERLAENQGITLTG